MVSSHGKRWITAAVALAVLVFVLTRGGQTGFALLVSLVVVLALLEYYGLMLPEETTMAIGLGAFCCLAIICGFFLGRSTGGLAVLLLSFALFCPFYLFREAPAHWTVERLSRQLLGLVYIPAFAGHVVMLRNGDGGLVWTVMLLAIVIGGDTGAYYVGKSMGRRKLCPRISPGKTIAGAVGGLITSIVLACVLKAAALEHLPWLYCVGMAAVTGAMAQIGDLFESVIKRAVNTKDSGRLLPGHGGVLDRIDGLLFAAPVLYYLKQGIL